MLVIFALVLYFVLATVTRATLRHHLQPSIALMSSRITLRRLARRAQIHLHI